MEPIQNKRQEEQEEQEGQEGIKANPFISKYAELKANSVSKEDYDQLKADNEVMAKILLSGENAPSSQNQEEKVDVEERNKEIQSLRDELYGGRYEGTDLDYATKTLKLRQLIMDSGKPDPAVSSGQKTSPEDYDYENCQSVCDQLQECIDYAKGDDAVFRAELLRRVNKK